MTQAGEPTLRQLTPGDIPAVVRVMEKIGWHHPLEQTRQYITWGGNGSFCLAFRDEVVATAIAMKYTQRLAWVGLVISHPDYQRRGFARRLMNHVMAYLVGVESIMLDASAAGYPLYDSMGFEPLYKINAYSGQPRRFEVHPSIRPMTAADLPQVTAMDESTFGIPRPHILRWLFDTGTGWVVSDDKALTGYTFTKVYGDTLRALAWNATDANTAGMILQAASTQAAEGGYLLRVNVPEPNIAARDLVRSHQMGIERYVTRMVYGNSPPGKMGEQYGIITFMTG